MLVHVTRYVDVQNHVRAQVEEVVRRMRQRIVRGTGSDALLAQLHDLWENDFIPTRDDVAVLSTKEEQPPVLPLWDEVVAALPNVLADIQVRSINGTAKDALDYATPGAALKVIAVGGDKLARGLTLEGLCVSYFVRTTKMYDTLMQMGRWFGYATLASLVKTYAELTKGAQAKEQGNKVIFNGNYAGGRYKVTLREQGKEDGVFINIASWRGK